MPPYFNQITSGPSGTEGDEYTGIRRIAHEADPFDPGNALFGVAAGMPFAAGAITPGPRMKGVVEGKYRPYESLLRQPAGKAPTEPYVYGPLQNLPVNSIGDGSYFLNPKTGMAAYTARTHQHEPMASAVNTKLGLNRPPTPYDNLMLPYGVGDDRVFGRIRQQDLGGGKAQMTVYPPYPSHDFPHPTRQRMEREDGQSMLDQLAKKGLLPPEIEVRMHHALGDF